MAGVLTVGDPTADNTERGPVVSRIQWDKIQTLIGKGITEGATVAAGGPGRPWGLDHGHYVRPTVFADVAPGMSVSREEIVGPAVAIIPDGSADESIHIANDAQYHLAAHVQDTDPAHAGRTGPDQRPRTGPVRALWRLQEIRERTGICGLGHPRFLRDKGAGGVSGIGAGTVDGRAENTYLTLVLPQVKPCK